LTEFDEAIGFGEMKLSGWLPVGVLTIGMLQPGCVEDVRFNPSGCEVHVRGRWLIDGENPNQETCGNIALVEVAIINEAENEFWVAPEFTLRCDAENDSNAAVIDGAAFIDTRIVTRNRCDGGGEILQENPLNEYKSRWRGTTDLKFIVDCTPIVITEITLDDGDRLLDLGTINLNTGEPGVECPSEL
jgi:hypothetical protein